MDKLRQSGLVPGVPLVAVYEADCWWAKGFAMKVTRVESIQHGYRGRLIVTSPKGEEIVNEIVNLSYGAQFGPDVEDIEAWNQVADRKIKEYLNTSV